MESEQRFKLKRVFTHIGQGLVVLIFCYLIFYVVFDKVSPHKTAKTLGFKNYSILTESMEPKLNRGDLIIVAKYDFDELNEGDIVTFVDPHRNVVTHRFVRYENLVIADENGVGTIQKVIRTKPEGEYPVDIWKIPEKDFIGKVSFSIPKVGNFIMFLQSWVGLITIVIVVGLGFVISYIFKELKNEKKQDITSDNQGDIKE